MAPFISLITRRDGRPTQVLTPGNFRYLSPAIRDQ